MLKSLGHRGIAWVVLLAPWAIASPALADPGIVIPEIVVEEFGDPTFYCTFNALIQGGTQVVGGGTDGFTVTFPPNFVTGTTSVPAGWQVAGTTPTSAFYRPILGNNITVPTGQPPLSVGLFQFATFWPANNYPPTLPAVFQFLTPGGMQQTMQDVPVRFVPEPASWVLLGLALPVVVGAVRLWSKPGPS